MRQDHNYLFSLPIKDKYGNEDNKVIRVYHSRQGDNVYQEDQKQLDYAIRLAFQKRTK